MYAIVQAGGKQYRVEENSVIEVNKINADEGDEVVLDNVLLLSTDEGVQVGTPHVTGAKVVGKVLRQFKGEKIDGFTYKPKKTVRRHYGHRQSLTEIKIEKIEVAK